MAFDKNGNPIAGNPNPLQNTNQFGQQPNTMGGDQKGDKKQQWDKFPNRDPLDPEKRPEEIEVEPTFKMSKDQRRNLKKKSNERVDRDIKGRRVHIKKKVESIIETESLTEVNKKKLKKHLLLQLKTIDEDINSAQRHLEMVLASLGKEFPEMKGKFMIYRRDLRARAHDVKEISQLTRIEVEKIEG